MEFLRQTTQAMQHDYSMHGDVSNRSLHLAISYGQIAFTTHNNNEAKQNSQYCMRPYNMGNRLAQYYASQVRVHHK